jgi:hypothetical protein
MHSINIKLRAAISENDVEEVAAKYSLTCSLKGSLKTKEANTHWHFKKLKQRGVLEITLYPANNEITLSFHDNRKGEWIEIAINQLIEEFRATDIN